MGSPLGPTLANFFLAHFENKFMSSALDCIPELYLRYVDDVFAVFSSIELVHKFLDFLNNLHPNLKFTCEIGPKSLAFLDTKTTLTEGGLTSEVYRKQTNTNVILNMCAFCPSQWKFGLITCFLNRAYTVCSTWSLFHMEITKLMDIFTSNGYPRHILEQCINKFVAKKFNSDNVRESESEEKQYVICIPYVGHASDNFKRRITSIFKELDIKTRVVFKSFRVGSYFSLKNATPLELKAKVVYEFVCSCDRSMSYIGKTKRHLAVRTKEHLKGNSAIFDHTSQCHLGHQCNIENFKVLSNGRSDLEIKIKEALLIKYQVF